jgi:hypothetical protein
MKGRITTVVVAVVVGGICWFFGLAVLSSISIALVIIAVGLLLLALPLGPAAADWPPGPPPAADGHRHDTDQLTWTLRARGVDVTERVRSRIQDLARNRLAARQLDLDNPAHQRAIRSLLGDPAYAFVRTGPHDQLTVKSINTTLDALDRLPHTPQHG